VFYFTAGILVKLLEDTMAENDPEAKQDADHKKAPSASATTARRTSTARTSKPHLR